MEQKNKRLSDEAFEVWVDIMHQINIIDTKLNPDELTDIHNNFSADEDDDFYIECRSERMSKAIGIFDDGSIALSIIGTKEYDHLDFHNWYDSSETIDVSVIVEDFLAR